MCLFWPEKGNLQLHMCLNPPAGSTTSDALMGPWLLASQRANPNTCKADRDTPYGNSLPVLLSISSCPSSPALFSLPARRRSRQQGFPNSRFAQLFPPTTAAGVDDVTSSEREKGLAVAPTLLLLGLCGLGSVRHNSTS